jgi:RNA polymerase sigma factor (sigma-70 family)
MPSIPTLSAQETFARLFSESRKALGRYVRKLVGSRDAAEEIVQEAFLRTYVQGDKVRAPRAFLFSIARNLAFDRKRHERIAATESTDDVESLMRPEPSTPLEDLLVADEASRLLKEAVDRLPPRCQVAFKLKVFHGFSYREIGEQLGVSEKTVEKHVAQGLQRTHSYLRARYAASTAPMDEEGSGDHG